MRVACPTCGGNRGYHRTFGPDPGDFEWIPCERCNEAGFLYRVKVLEATAPMATVEPGTQACAEIIFEPMHNTLFFFSMHAMVMISVAQCANRLIEQFGVDRSEITYQVVERDL